MLLRAICLTLTLAVWVDRSYSELASTWDYCECRWELWEGWSECNSDCFGERVRTRSVWITHHPGCEVFTDCASSDEGQDGEDCNDVCYNGGSATGYHIFGGAPCDCQLGYYASCCTERVNCGSAEEISYGSVSVTSTDYGGVATYSCNTEYNMTTGDAVRTCQDDFAWSGAAPECVFAYHCNSAPCMNGATCVNLLGDFKCNCADGWDGILCEDDVQPPVMVDCSGDVEVNATDSTVNFGWTEPSFYDPMGNDLHIVSNYPDPSFTFPWGDHTVQYVATKTSNGLTTECIFKVKVRPTPCEELNVPVNGARLCNGWKTDYGRFCMVTCQQNYTLTPGTSFHTMYVCGASGSWIAPSPMPNCIVEVTSTADALIYQPEYSAYVYEDSCESVKPNLQDLYVDHLLSTDGFSSFCTNFPDDCTADNVDVQCGATWS